MVNLYFSCTAFGSGWEGMASRLNADGGCVSKPAVWLYSFSVVGHGQSIKFEAKRLSISILHECTWRMLGIWRMLGTAVCG